MVIGQNRNTFMFWSYRWVILPIIISHEGVLRSEDLETLSFGHSNPKSISHLLKNYYLLMSTKKRIIRIDTNINHTKTHGLVGCDIIVIIITLNFKKQIYHQQRWQTDQTILIKFISIQQSFFSNCRKLPELGYLFGIGSRHWTGDIACEI